MRRENLLTNIFQEIVTQTKDSVTFTVRRTNRRPGKWGGLIRS
jgi:hypothetical protein